MIKADDFRTELIQVSIYQSNLGEITSAKVLGHILSKYLQPENELPYYDGDPQVISLPPEAPFEIPRLVLESKDGRWKLEARLNRLSSVWLAKDEEGPINLKRQIERCADVLLHYIRETKMSVGRLACVLRHISEQDNAAEMLAEHFCKNDIRKNAINRSDSFEIHNHKAYLWEAMSLKVNSWVRCQSTFHTEDKTRSAIAVIQDINTLDQVRSEAYFEHKDVQAFFGRISDESRTILKKYFS